MAITDPVDVVCSARPVFVTPEADMRLVGFICKDGPHWRAFWGIKSTVKLSRVVDNALMRMVTKMVGSEIVASQYHEVIEVKVFPPMTERWIATEVAIAGFEAGMKVVEEAQKRSI